MKSPGLLVLVLTVLSSNAVAGVTGAGVTPAGSPERSCIVQNTLTDGSYTFFHCQGASNDVWVATPKISVSIGEQLFFADAPPLVNFEAKALKRTFPRLIFTTVIKADERRNNSERKEPFRLDDEATYSGADENGTIVFSDNPAKVPNRRRPVDSDTNSSGVVRIDSTKLEEKDRKLLPIVQQALNSYCTGDKSTLKSLTLPAYWTKLKRTIDRGDEKKFCFEEVETDAAENFDSRSDLDNKIYPTAKFTLLGIRHAGSEDGVLCTAFFVKNRNGWKYVDIFCGASSVIGYPPGFRQP